MTDPADRHLEERLHALARGVSVPVVAAADDVRRGRRRLLRVRLAMAGATTGTLAVVLGITSLTAGDPQATEIEPATHLPSTTVPASPESSPTEDVRGSGSQGKADGGAAGAGTGAGTDEDSDVDATAPGTSPGGSATGAATEGTRGGTGAGHWPSHEPTSDPTGTATDEPTEEPSGSPTDLPTSTPTETPTQDPTDPPTTPPPTTGPVHVNKVLDYYNDVVAEHLDPARDHLQEYDPAIDAKHTSRRDGHLFALGSTYRWGSGRDPADVRVHVASGWDQVAWGCGAADSDWVCHAAPTAEVAVHDGLVEAAVEHADGQVVVVAADLPEADLVAAAGDQRLVLPGDAPPQAPPTLDPETFASYGEAALVLGDESFTRASLDRTPSVRGTWTVDGTDRGTLTWSVDPIYSGGGWECLSGYRTCTDVPVEVDGVTRTVHLARLRKKLGGGWLAQYDGPSYAARVTSTDRAFPKKRAYLFVTDDDWQPVR
jgi:hypothetical protein